MLAFAARNATGRRSRQRGTSLEENKGKPCAVNLRDFAVALGAWAFGL